MKTLLIALVGSVVWVAGASQQSPTYAIPKLTPAESWTRNSGGSGGPVGNNFSPSAHFYQRLATDLPLPAVVSHYEAQLVAVGWKATFRQSEATLAVVRFSVGSPTETLVGTLTVIPFATAKQTLVSVRLVRNNWPWPEAGRSGGGGAGASSGFPVRFGSRTVRFPATVTRVSDGQGSGTPGYMLHERRLQGLMTPAALMTHLESQISKDGWRLEARTGDAVQAVIRRSSMRDAETYTSEVWMITTMPGTSEIDAVLIDIQTWLGKKE